jgi:hypothetical protein
MIAQNLHRLKVEKSSQHLTSFAGLPLLSELAHQVGIIDRLDAIPGLWEREGLYKTSDYVMSLALTLIAGGEGLDDTRILRSDPGLGQLVFPNMPAANSVGRFLRRFDQRSLYRLGEAVTEQALKNLGAYKTLTLDVDSTLIESEKDEAKRTYKGFEGYNPLLAWLAEPDVFIAGVFREGNASPQSHLLPLLKYCHRRLPPGVDLRLRSDSAGFRLDLIDYCRLNGIGFTIGADLDPAVMEAIEHIPKKAWQLVVRGEDTFLLAETIHVPGGGDNRYDLPAFRLVVTQRVNAQLELFEPAIRYHAILSDFPDTWTAEQILDHHNARGTAEKAIGEFKNGFGLRKLPCGQLFANAAFFQIGLLAYNLVQTFKRFALPEGWKTFCIKNLRFRLLCQAAIVIRHARRIVLKLSAAFPNFDVFESARWAVLSPQVACPA